LPAPARESVGPNAVSNVGLAAHHHAVKLTKTHPIPRCLGSEEHIVATANYRPSALGPGYFTVLSVEGEPVTTTLHGADVHAALHAVLDSLEEVADRRRCPLLTVHRLNGDPAAFTELAQAEAFTACVPGGLG
jgi:hypothetical protein